MPGKDESFVFVGKSGYATGVLPYIPENPESLVYSHLLANSLYAEFLL